MPQNIHLITITKTLVRPSRFASTGIICLTSFFAGNSRANAFFCPSFSTTVKVCTKFSKARNHILNFDGHCPKPLLYLRPKYWLTRDIHNK
jgi:hypothetical protein